MTWHSLTHLHRGDAILEVDRAFRRWGLVGRWGSPEVGQLLVPDTLFSVCHSVNRGAPTHIPAERCSARAHWAK